MSLILHRQPNEENLSAFLRAMGSLRDLVANRSRSMSIGTASSHGGDQAGRLGSVSRGPEPKRDAASAARGGRAVAFRPCCGSMPARAAQVTAWGISIDATLRFRDDVSGGKGAVGVWA